MPDWLCLKNNVVLNVIANLTITEINANPDITNQYDNFIDTQTVMTPDIWIGAILEADGTWTKAPKPPVSQDFSNQTLAGMNFTDTDLSGSIFLGASLDDAKFRGAFGDFTFVGASWGGQTIAHGPVWITNDFYYCLVTDVVTIMGCQMIATGDVAGMTPPEVSGSDPKYPDKPARFWAQIKDEFLALVAGWAP